LRSVLLGAKMPHVLRRVSGLTGAERYRLIDEAYIYRFIDSEAVRNVSCRTESFRVV
jgi:hypothetical protein